MKLDIHDRIALCAHGPNYDYRKAARIGEKSCDTQQNPIMESEYRQLAVVIDLGQATVLLARRCFAIKKSAPRTRIAPAARRRASRAD